MITRACLLVWLCLAAQMLLAAEVRWTGMATGAGGKALRIYRYDDLVSQRKVPLAKAWIDASGRFEISFEMQQTGMVFLFIDYHRAEFLVEPGQHYHMQVEGFNLPGYREEINPFLDPPWLDILLLDSNSLLLARCYDSLNAISDRYIAAHAMAITRGNPPHPADTLIQAWRSSISCAGFFMETAIRYRVAHLHAGASRRAKARVFQRFLQDQPTYPDHPDYMLFFAQFFDKHLSTSLELPFHELARILDENQGYAALLDFMGRDSLLRAANLRELVLLVNARDLYSHPQLNGETVLRVLDQMRLQARVATHREMAANLLGSLQQLGQGTPAPAFFLHTARGDSLRLEDYKGKLLFMQFFTTWCADCVADILLMHKLQEEFGDRIRFLSISADLEPANLPPFLRRYTLAWDMAHFAGDFALLEAYRVRAYPTYIMVDTEGSIIAAPATSPGGGAAVYFSRMLQPLRKQ